MMLQWMLGAVTFTAFAALTAWAAEALLRTTNGQTRWPWIAAIVASVVWCIAAPLVARNADPTIATPIIVGTPVLAPVFTALQETATTPVAQRWWNTERIVLLAWVLVSVALFTRLAATAWTIRMLKRRAERSDVDGVGVLLSDTAGPAVVGVFQPDILIPRWVMQFDADLRRAILTHEQEHRIAHDPALLFAVAFVTFLLPWNVALWFMSQRLRHAVEVDCDRRTLRTTADASRYAKLLLLLANHRLQLRFTPMMATESTLSRRIRAMHTPPLSFRSPRALGVIAVGVIGVAGACATRLPTNVNAPTTLNATHIVAPAPDSVQADRGAELDTTIRQLKEISQGTEREQSPPYFDFQVDKPAVAVPGNPAPRYPAELRARGVEGMVLMQYVVNIDGSIDTSTTKVLRTSDPAFVQSLREVLAHMKYEPAEVRGAKVRQLVQQPFVFSLPNAAPDTARRLTVRDENGRVIPGLRAELEPQRSRFVRDENGRVIPGLRAELASQLPRVVRDSSQQRIIVERRREAARQQPAYFDFQVDKPATPVSGNRAPLYPAELRSRGIEGEALVQFVVNEDGTVDMSTFKVLRTADSLFAAAVREVLPSYTFTPAEIFGKKVKQLVQLPFVFSPGR